MQSTRQLKAIPDDELLHRLAALLEGSRHTEADLVALIGEVDARRLYAREASPSMFAYCLERLRLSEAEACLRIAAARASREHPVILTMLADGRLHLSAIAKLAPHLTFENRDSLLQRATHKTKREIDEIVAELAPRPDVPPSIRRLPRGRLVASPASKERMVGPDTSTVLLGLRPEQVDSHPLGGLVAPRLDPSPDSDGAPDCEPPACLARADIDVRWVAGRKARPEVIEPLSPSRYRVQFTASAELCGKLERLKDLMRASIPDGGLASIIDAAVTDKLERLEARRFGQTKSPRKQAPTKQLAQAEAAPSSRHVPAAVKRAVHGRDGGRCRYVDEQGRRCTARAGLEFHHRRPYALGGEHSPTNVSELCRVHNQHLARVDFGSRAVGEHRRRTATAASIPGVILRLRPPRLSGPS